MHARAKEIEQTHDVYLWLLAPRKLTSNLIQSLNKFEIVYNTLFPKHLLPPQIIEHLDESQPFFMTENTKKALVRNMAEHDRVTSDHRIEWSSRGWLREREVRPDCSQPARWGRWTDVSNADNGDDGSNDRITGRVGTSTCVMIQLDRRIVSLCALAAASTFL